ncbi:MAG: hypothetical protein ACRDT4_13825 [Micromonosporaceae bacterium]
MTEQPGSTPDPGAASSPGGFPSVPPMPPVTPMPEAGQASAEEPEATPTPPAAPSAPTPAPPAPPAAQPVAAQPAAQPVAAQPVAPRPAQPAYQTQSPYQTQPAGYVLATPHLPPTNSGMGTGGLISGIASCLLALTGCCWWPLAGLPLVMGLGAVTLGLLGLRQVAGSGGEVTGKGVSIAAIATGGAGVLLSLVALGLSAIAAATA